MKRYMILKSLIICAIIATSCNKDDDNKNGQDCVKEENFFEAEFQGEIIEPRWITGGGVSAYTLSVNRNNEDENDWEISLTSNNRISLNFSLVNVNGTGNYLIEAATSSELPPPPFTFSKTYIYVEKIVDNSTIYYFSKEGSGDIRITDYNSEDGILIGTFNCELYNSFDPSIISPISGDFNINLSTLNIDEKPCWL
ncbi:hypothetical protein [Aequorivita capsosiphonis]|uniref:hypothetical protein n=1 Tax=Aequorivita capsosiphonis TaxID=487317 RepID=UPI0003F6F3D9|nr:hypothetical protein [Aequorivita capsosiphonis]